MAIHIMLKGQTYETQWIICQSCQAELDYTGCGRLAICKAGSVSFVLCRYCPWFRALNDIARYSTGSCQGSYELGHARIALGTHETLCTLCIFGTDVNMKVKSTFQGSFMVDVELECK